MSTALYRRYRPETFADVIGQEHVTAPLMAAIEKGRINHAYLFSGPRGCGKTTSARILARCLNCAKGPTPTPCGVCDSCVELARNGSGSLDVIEIDAASHGGVDDARDLRERATFAPVRDRYKIFIIDEAHMVTSAGFNALLKIVEEPPEHILFIFATTEPDKVIGTIRSRTHHYPFRLVPPEPLIAYLELLCRQENVSVAPGVLSLVIRAGGGSVRDSLSVLDQLMAGAGESGLDYELAVSLLGYTHATLLDDVVDAVAAGDAATVFTAVDRVIQTGHDPRRFVEDLLERFRDLIVVRAVPEGAASVLRGVPEDQLNRMRTQANQLGAGELSRAADVTNTALTEMTGATSPRLHLELLCARLLLPAADESATGTLARVDRIERRLEYAGGAAPLTAPAQGEAPSRSTAPAQTAPAQTNGLAREAAGDRASRSAAAPSAAPAPSVPATSNPTAVPAAAASTTIAPETAAAGATTRETSELEASAAPTAAETRPSTDPSSAERGAQVPAPSPDWGGSWGADASTPAQDVAAASRPAASVPESARTEPARAESAASETVQPETTQREPARAESGTPERPQGGQSSAAATAPAEQVSGGGSGQVEMIRRAWPEIMEELAKIKRITWLNVNVDAKPRSFDGNQLVLAFATPGNAIAFQRGPHMDNVKQAIHKVLGLTCSIEAILDGQGESGPKVPASRPTPARAASDEASGPHSGPAQATPPGTPGSGPTPSVQAQGGSQSGAAGAQPQAQVRTGERPQGQGHNRPQSGAQPSAQSQASVQPHAGTQTPDRTPPAHAQPQVGAQPRAGAQPSAQSQADAQPHAGTQTPDRTPPAHAQSQAGAQPSAQSQASVQPHSRAQAPDRSAPVHAQPQAGAQPSAQSQAGAQPHAGSQVPDRTPPAQAQPQAGAHSQGSARPHGGAQSHGGAQTPNRTPPTRPQTGAQASPMAAPGAVPEPQRWATDPAPLEAGSGAMTAAPSAGQGGPGAAAPRRSAAAGVPERDTAPDPMPTPGWTPDAPDDDSWAMVEPPEDAYDPGPGYSAAPSVTPHAEAVQAQRNGSTPAAAVSSARPASPAGLAAETGAGGSGSTADPSPAGSRSPQVQALQGRTTQTDAPRPDAGSAARTPQQATAPTSPGQQAASPAARPAAPGAQHAAGQTAPAQQAAAQTSPERTTPAVHRTTGQAAPNQTAPDQGSAQQSAAQQAPSQPATSEPAPLGKPVSRYQRLLDEAARKRAESAAAGERAVDFKYVEDEPSADDETIEEAGLVGRSAIERILNGRLIEERGIETQ